MGYNNSLYSFLVQDYEYIYENYADDFEAIRGLRIALTGASGMLSKYIIHFIAFLNRRYDFKIHVAALEINEDFLVFDYNEYIEEGWLEAIVGDVRFINIEDSRLRADIIINSASPTSPYDYEHHPATVATINIIGTHKCLELAKKNSSKLILVSSSSVYGNTTNDTIDENAYGPLDNLVTSACYSEGKRAAETLCVAYNKEYGVQTYIARCRRIFGPTANMKSKSLLNKLLQSASQRKSIDMFRDPDNMIQLIYLGDVLSGLFEIIAHGISGEAYNISTNYAISVDELASIIEALENDGLKINWIDKETINDSVRTAKQTNRNNGSCVSTKLQNISHFKQLFPLEKGLANTINSLRLD